MRSEESNMTNLQKSYVLVSETNAQFWLDQLTNLEIKLATPILLFFYYGLLCTP